MSGSTAAISTPAVAEHPAHRAMLLGALGVVFGDIGTSPIYAFRESLRTATAPCCWNGGTRAPRRWRISWRSSAPRTARTASPAPRST
jgi:K+ potassium transporter